MSSSADGPDGDGLPLPRRYVAIAAMCLGTLLTILDGSIATVALPTIARDLHVPGSAAVLVVTVYQLTLVMALLPFASLGDRIGLKRTYQTGQIAFTIATILCFFTKSLPFLLIVRFFQSLGAAAALSCSTALIRRIYPARQLGRGLGVNSVMVSTAAALAPTLGGWILGVAPWPWVFAAAVPFALLSLLLGRTLPNVPPRDAPYDLAGALMSALMFGLVIGGLEGLVHGDSPVVAAAVLLVGVVIGFFFIQRERGRAQPILPVDLLGRPVLALSAAGAFLAFCGSQTFILSLPFRLQQSYGFSPAETGTMIAPWPLTTMIVAPLAGTLSDRFPAGALGGIGMIMSTIALLAFAWLPPHPSWFDVAWRVSLCGAGFGTFLSPNARLIIGSAPPHRSAAAGSLVATTRLFGQTMGATLIAALLALELGQGRVPPFVAAGLAVIAGAFSLARLNPSLRKPRHEEAEALQDPVRRTA